MNDYMYYIFITEDKYNRECRVIPVDFTAGLDIYSDISDQLSGLDVGVLGECSKLPVLLT